jgi:hypothetical protein
MATVTLAKPHTAQQSVLDEARRYNVLACGRRWGKTQMGTILAIDAAGPGAHPVGWFAPTYKFLEEAWDTITDTLDPLGPRVKLNKSERTIKLWTGGRIDFWTLERPNAGRGRKYVRAILDEAAIVRSLGDYFMKAVRPTLTDYQGDAWFLSTPYGHNDFHRLWVRGQQGDEGWASWQMPTAANPYMLPEEIEEARIGMPADAFSQEYLAEFLADAANPFGVDAIRSCVSDLAIGEPVIAWGVDLAKSTDHTVAIGLGAGGRAVAFQRWQSDWRNTTARLAAMIGDTPALVDSTGVGDPIVEELQARCPLVEGYKFTQQSKQQLMEGLAVAIQRHEVTYPDGPIVRELEVFEYEYTRTGVRYTAPEGMHDDCVDALALAVRCKTLRPLAISLDSRGIDDRMPTGADPWSEWMERDELWT